MFYHKECAKSQLMLTNGSEEEVDEAHFCCESCFMGLRKCNVTQMTASTLQTVKVGSLYLNVHQDHLDVESIRECAKCGESVENTEAH